MEDIPVIYILLTCPHLWNIACGLPKAKKKKKRINAAQIENKIKLKSAISNT